MNFTSRTAIQVLVVVIGVGAGGFVAERRLAASPAPVNSTKADSPPRVEVVRPRRVTVSQLLQTNATLEAFEEADLFAKLSGYLSDVRVDIGDHVKAGEVLATAEIAKADLGVAEANRDLAANQVDLAAATVEKIKTLLGYTQIVAPFDGVVARRQVNRGDLVQAATATRTTPSAGSLFTLQRIDTIRVFCDVT